VLAAHEGRAITGPELLTRAERSLGPELFTSKIAAVGVDLGVVVV
jgi:hypothetical protein